MALAASTLTREAVIDVAGELVAEEGYEALTMRELADRCGVATMTLYRHVRTKEDLLGALADRFFAELPLPAESTGPWEEEVAGVFRALHRTLIEHPELVEIVARQHINGHAAYRGAERMLKALTRAGIEGEAAATAFTTLVAYTVGFAQRQLYDARTRLSERLAVIDDLPPEDFRTVAGMGTTLLTSQTDRHYEDGLALILRGLASS